MLFTRLVLGFGLLALMAAPGAADPALAVSDVNMRRGPSTDAPVILLIPGGSNVEVLGCGAGWCEVAFGGRAGFANQRFFDFGGDPPPPPRRVMGPPPSYPVPSYPSPAYPQPVYPPPPGYGPPPYPRPTYPPSPDREYYPPPGYREQLYPPPYGQPLGPPGEREYDEVLPPPGIDPRALPQRPAVRPPQPRPPTAAQPRPAPAQPAMPPRPAPAASRSSLRVAPAPAGSARCRWASRSVRSPAQSSALGR